jgi:enoyl-[acyl-carrier-protein] reductase (NADH)
VHRLAKCSPTDTRLLGVRTTKAGEDTINELRDLAVTADIRILELDMTDDDNVRNPMDEVKARFAKLDGLWNCLCC